MSIDPMPRTGDAKADTLRARPALSAQNAAKTYDNGAVIALNHVSLDIAQGEFFTLLGPSGSGKTTLLRLFAGFESPSRGAIFLDGQDVTLAPPYKRPLNTVFQSYALFPHLTVAQNIAFGLEMKKTPKAEIAATVDAMLDLVQMRHLAARKPSQLSGGQQQRVALARALAPKPKVLLLDEPLSALDLKLRKEMQIELKRLQTETGITFVFVTHDQEEALTMSDRIAVLNGGEILQVGTPREIYERPANRFVAGFIGETNFLNATVEGGEVMLSGQKTGLKPHPDATHMTLCLRPERLHFNPAKDDLVLQADVTQVVYFGTDSHVHATLTSGEAVVLRLQAGAELPEKGARITLGCQRAHLQPIEDETASGAA